MNKPQDGIWDDVDYKTQKFELGRVIEREIPKNRDEFE